MLLPLFGFYLAAAFIASGAKQSNLYCYHGAFMVDEQHRLVRRTNRSSSHSNGFEESCYLSPTEWRFSPRFSIDDVLTLEKITSMPEYLQDGS